MTSHMIFCDKSPQTYEKAETSSLVFSQISQCVVKCANVMISVHNTDENVVKIPICAIPLFLFLTVADMLLSDHFVISFDLVLRKPG